MGYSMRKNKTYHRKKTVLLWVLCMGMMVGLAGRLVYLCVFRSVYYSEKADDLHERERGIKAARAAGFLMQTGKFSRQTARSVRFP